MYHAFSHAMGDILFLTTYLPALTHCTFYTAIASRLLPPQNLPDQPTTYPHFPPPLATHVGLFPTLVMGQFILPLFVLLAFLCHSFLISYLTTPPGLRGLEEENQTGQAWVHLFIRNTWDNILLIIPIFLN